MMFRYEMQLINKKHLFSDDPTRNSKARMFGSHPLSMLEGTT
jgi:hypothetical protein